jgi:membrane protein DedA with SNARE-associated domain
MDRFLLIALGTFASEDLTCIAAGALIASGKIEWLPGLVACIVGIYFGDILLYAVGRLAGRPIARRLVTGARLDRASQWLNERGAGVVMLSRLTPGLRLPTYLAAGMLRTRFWTFNMYFLIAALLWTPLLVGSAVLLGKGAPRYVFLAIPLAFIRVPWRTRRRIAGRLKRFVCWEFWPPWLAYLPVVPYILWLGVKHRSLTLFTAANPGIPSGGFAGESKSAILAQLPYVPEYQVMPAGARNIAVSEFPVVLKPDVGERGTGVVIARSAGEVDRYLAQATRPTIVQKYVGGVEFGVFYCRRPGEAEGRILSITEKRFPEVVGDGETSLTGLVLRDNRAVCLANVYKTPDRVPSAGERVPLVEIGSHCRGAVFLDGSGYETPELRAAIDAAAKSHAGFFFGRFDLRAPSLADLQAGRFHILELNGVSAEPAHIYDPAVTLRDSYSALFRHWRLAFEIGAANSAAGARPTPISELFSSCVPAWLRRSRRILRQFASATRPSGAATGNI